METQGMGESLPQEVPTIFINQDKILELNKKAIEDTDALCSSADKVISALNAYSNLPKDDLEHVSSVFLAKGRKIFLELEVKDSLMSGALFKWLYQENSMALGCQLKAIHFETPGFTQTELEAIKILSQRIK